MEAPQQVTTQERKAFAIERLMRDLREIEENPLRTIYASPVEDNIFLWHANLIGVVGSDYEGNAFHMEFIFPEDYPMHPPQVRLLTTVKRDHVFGEWICLDMLQSWSGFSQKKYTGWTTAYSTLSILLQLQSFIFESEKYADIWRIRQACINACEYECKTCPHNMKKNQPWPWREGMQEPFDAKKTNERFESPTFKKAYEQEEEINKIVAARIKGSKNTVSPQMESRWREEAKQEAEKMRLFVEENRKKLQRLELLKQQNELKKQQKLEKTKQSQGEVDNYIPGDDAPKAKKKVVAPKKEVKIVAAVEEKKVEKKTLTKAEIEQEKKDKLLNTLWHTKLNALAPAFVPRGVASVQKSENKEVKTEESQKNVETREEIEETIESLIEMIPGEILYYIFTYVKDATDLERCANVCSTWRNVLRNTFIIEKRETVCFHSKRTYEEDVLGVGAQLTFHEKSGTLQYVTSRIDLLSHTAYYKELVRQSVWQEPFTNFIPLFLNRAHGARSMPLLKVEIERIYQQAFDPWLAIDLFAKLMNTMVVSVMSGELHGSIVALQGYCYFHRMLIAIVEEYPDMKEVINQKVRDFISNEFYRHKRQCPSIGDFLPLLTISSYSWADLAVPVVKETLIRNVLWIVKKHPSLAKVDREYNLEKETQRTAKSFVVSTTSLRLIMFHVYFLVNVAKVGKVSIEETARGYDSRFGRPERDEQEKLQKAIFSIKEVDNYKKYFAKVKLPKPSDEMLHQLLKESVMSSQRKRYHKPEHLNKRNVHVETKKKPKRAALNVDDLDDY